MQKCKNCFFQEKNAFVVDTSRNDVICVGCGAVQDHIRADNVVSMRHSCSTSGEITSACEFVTTCTRPNKTTGKVDMTVMKLAKQYGEMMDATEKEMDNAVSLIAKHPKVRLMKPIAATVVATIVLLKRENNTMGEYNIRKMEKMTGMKLGDRLVRIANEYNRDTIKDPVLMIPMVVSRLGLPQRYNKFLKSIYLRKFEQFQKMDIETRRPNRSTIFAVVVYRFFEVNKGKSSFRDKIDLDFIAEITQTTTSNIKRFLNEYGGVRA